MDENNIKRCSIPLVIRKTKSKTRMRYDYILIKMDKIEDWPY